MRLVASVLLATLTLACNASAPAASPSAPASPGSPPGGSPGSSPSHLPTPSPRPTSTPDPTPTATPAGTPGSTPGQGEIGHPTGASDVILRMDEGGGHMIFGYDLAAAPTFTLYGDGTYILRQLEDPERADPALGFTRFLHGQMNDEYVQALLRFALGQGRLLDAKEDYPNNSCADCTTTTFTLNAAGLEKAVSIYALGQDEGPDAADRRGFGELRETITGLEHRAKSGELGEVVLYDPEFYRVVLLEGFGDAPADWPWDHISVDDFELVAESGHRQLIMGRDDVEMLIEVPSGGHPGIVVEDEDGALWQIGVRPLLPEELPADLPADG